MDYLKIGYLLIGSFLVGVIGLSITASGKSDSYYVEQKSDVYFKYYCVMGDVNWRTDRIIYCSEDITKVLMLNVALSSKPPQTTE